jgi:hypothetical protein
MTKSIFKPMYSLKCLIIYFFCYSQPHGMNKISYPVPYVHTLKLFLHVLPFINVSSSRRPLFVLLYIFMFILHALAFISVFTSCTCIY